MAAATLVPTELIERILEFAADIDTPTALSVCLTNKLGRRAAERTLYHTLDISGVDNDCLVDVRLRRLSLLSRTLLNNPALARHVRHIKAYIDDLDEVTYKAPPQLDHRAFDRLVKDLAISDGQKRSVMYWLGIQNQHGREIFRQRGMDLDDGHEEQDDDDDTYDSVLEPFFGPELFLSVLTLACSNLEAIDISGCPQYLEPIVLLHEALNRNDPPSLRHSLPNGLKIEFYRSHRSYVQGLPRPDGLAKVKAVHFNCTHDLEGEGWPVTVFEDALTWPSIEMMTIQSLTGRFADRRERPLYSSTLKRLDLTDATITDVSELECLLQPCPQLRAFTLKWNGLVDVYRDVEWRKLGRALAESNPLLENICLDIAPHAQLRDIQPNVPVNSEGIGLALTGLKHLRKLSAPYVALFGVFDNPYEQDVAWDLPEIVPNSIEEIEVFSEGVEFSHDDRALVKKAPGSSRTYDITVRNCTRTKWISKSRGEGQLL